MLYFDVARATLSVRASDPTRARRLGGQSVLEAQVLEPEVDPPPAPDRCLRSGSENRGKGFSPTVCGDFCPRFWPKPHRLRRSLESPE
jgi:hypothetical protein